MYKSGISDAIFNHLVDIFEWEQTDFQIMNSKEFNIHYNF